MHIPDNFLSPPVWASLDLAAAPAVIWVSKKAQAATSVDRLPLLGVMGAFIFAAQMINFPLAVGTSGHLVGGALLACLLGPWPAALVLTGVLVIQSLVFQDGGVLALGANVVNMALLGVWAGYLPARLLRGTRWHTVGVFAGGFCSVMASGGLAIIELLLSHVRMSSALVGFSLLVFSLNAAVEGLLTVSVLRSIERLRPGTLDFSVESRSQHSGWGRLAGVTGIASITLACAAVFIASTKPDGIEHLAAVLRIPLSAHPVLLSPLRNYEIEGLGGNWFSRAGAGLAGIGIVYLLCAAAGSMLTRVRRSYS